MLFLNDKQLKPEVAPKITDGTTMVPVRIITEELGAKVEWYEPEFKVTVKKDSLNMVLYIDKKETMVNGKPYMLESAPVIEKGNTLLPVRFISENMGLKVLWDDLTRTVTLLQQTEASPSPSVQPTPTPTASAAPTLPVSAAPTPTPTASPTPSAPVSPKPASSSTPAPTSSVSPTPSSSSSVVKPSASPGTPQLTEVALEGNILRVKTGASTVPSFLELSNPERLVMDLPGAVLSKKVNGAPAVQNGTIPFEHPLIKSVRYSLFSDNPNTVRIVVDLKQKIEYNLLESGKPGEISLSLAPYRYKLVLDAGHGAHDPGAISVKGRQEKDFNLALVLKIAQLLEKEEQIETILTRSGDTFLTPEERAVFANERKSDLFISVHANKYTKSSVRGVETYWWKSDSKEAGAIFHRNIVAATGFPDRGLKQNDFKVVKLTEKPAVLLEIGYLSNAAEEQALFTESLQDKVAASIVAGIKEYLQIP